MSFPEWVSPDGRVRLINADCLAVLPEIGDGSVDAVVTSPPYNQLGERMPDEPSGIWKDMGRGFLDSVNERGYADDVPEDEYQRQQNELFGAISRVVGESGSLFYNHQCRWRDGALLHPVEWFKPSGWTLRQDIVWDRCGGMMFNARMFCRFDERILWFVKSSRHKWNQDVVGMGTVWRIPRATNKTHPVAFPVDLPFRCIKAVTDVDDLVLEPYGGSATTAIACIRTDRRCICIEKEEKYWRIGIERCQREYARTVLFNDQEACA